MHMRSSCVLTGLLLVAACGGSAREDPTGPDPSASVSADDDGEPETTLAGGNETAERFDVGGGGESGAGDEGGSCAPKPTNATLTGTVFAPNMEIPISGALVYTTNAGVEGVPDGVYCSECVELTCDTPFVLTEPDGTFELPAVAGAGQKLVVQKGEFLRVVDIDIAEGDAVVPHDQSNLPGQWNPPEGMWTPKIAVYRTDPDRVYNVLAKFGLGETTAAGELVPGTEQFVLIPDSDQGAFMDDFIGMKEFHIIFVPCAATKEWLGAPAVKPLRAQNIRDYVAAGGKWYATDHSNEYIEAPFSDYQEFHSPFMPDIQPAYDVQGTVVDEDLLAWLDALPPALKDIGGGNPTLGSLPSVELMLNYSGIDVVSPVIVQDEDGNDVDVGHHTWVEGPCTSCSDPQTIRPMAVSGQWGCGRMMYSTFENSSVPHAGLNPQELILLYMILEISVCHEETPPPPPPAG
jgi:hypothetical protein